MATGKKGTGAYPALMLLLPARRVYRSGGMHFCCRRVYDLEGTRLEGFRLHPVVDYSLEGIPSDREVVKQINDRISFKKFWDYLWIGLGHVACGEPSPDHSTLCSSGVGH